MSGLRQLGSGLLYAVVSVVLVVGGLSLALAESGASTPPPSAVPAITTQPATPTATLEPTASVEASPIVITATQQVVTQAFTLIFPSATDSPRPSVTPGRAVYPTAAFSCGPYAGWVKSYIVQPGDTLFHIATLHRTTYTALEIANCRSSTIIYVGERLWVPNVPTSTPGVTLIPTFPTSTPFPTEPLTLTPELPYFTETTAPPTEGTSTDP